MRKLRELWLDRRGAFAPMTALVLTVIIGFGALTVDMGYNYYIRNKLQVAADASALAGASQLRPLIDDDDQEAMKTEAVDYAKRNMPVDDYGNVLVPDADVLVGGDLVAGNWDPDTRTFTIGAEPLNAVRTVTRQEEGSNNAVPAFLGGIAGFSSYDISASAVATEAENGNETPSGCLMATNTTEAEAFYIFGTADITTADCSIEVASTAACAFTAHGNPSITTISDEEGDELSPINIAGTYCDKGAVAIDPDAINEDADVSEDPYEDIDPCDGWALCEAARDPNYCDGADEAFVNATFEGSIEGPLPSGVYCGGITWTGSGEATFEGDYIIKDGPLEINGSMAIDGSSGVGFYLMGTGSVVDFGGTADMTLVAQSDGSEMDGFIFYEEEKTPQESHTLRGTNGGGYDGLLYFDGDVELKGTSDAGLGATSDCTVLIADTIYFNGTTGLDANSTCAGSGPSLPPGAPIYTYRLVD